MKEKEMEGQTEVSVLVRLMGTQSDNIENATRVLNTAERAVGGKFTVEINVPVINAIGEHSVVRSKLEFTVRDEDGSKEFLSAIAVVKNRATKALERYYLMMGDLVPGLKTDGEIAEGD